MLCIKLSQKSPESETRADILKAEAEFTTRNDAHVKGQSAFWNLLDSFNISVSSYGFMLNFTPVFDKLKPELRSPSNGRLAVILALMFVGFAYISFGELSIAYFGAVNVEQNVFTNFGREHEWLSVIILLWFIVIFLCSLPFNFHPLKVCVLNLIGEFRSRKITNELDEIFKMNEKDGEMPSKKAIEEIVSTCQHASVVSVLIICIAIAALFISDLTIVFGIVGAFCENLVNFVLPGAYLFVTGY